MCVPLAREVDAIADERLATVVLIMVGATKGILDVALPPWSVAVSGSPRFAWAWAACPESGRQLAQTFRFADNVRAKMLFASYHYKTMTNETAQINHQIDEDGD
jgi:hypothetical protein